MAVITNKTRFYKNEQLKYCPFLEASNAELLAMQAKGLYNFRTSDNDGFINLNDITNGLKLRVYGVGNFVALKSNMILKSDYFYLVRTKLVIPTTTIDWEAKILGVVATQLDNTGTGDNPIKLYCPEPSTNHVVKVNANTFYDAWVEWDTNRKLGIRDYFYGDNGEKYAPPRRLDIDVTDQNYTLEYPVDKEKLNISTQSNEDVISFISPGSCPSGAINERYCIQQYYSLADAQSGVARTLYELVRIKGVGSKYYYVWAEVKTKLLSTSDI